MNRAIRYLSTPPSGWRLRLAMLVFFSGLPLFASEANQLCTVDGLPVFGYLENARLVNIDQHPVQSLVDSGATTTALDARNIRMHIKRNGTRWVYYDFVHRQSSQKTPMHQPVSRVARIITHKGAPSERAVVRNTIKVGQIMRTVETSLISRSNFPQQLLIGRNFLKDTALIDSGKRYLQESCP
ncbi:RimK/LysX family protein [Endozoicomonas sp. SCSIO W0465]|uniref:putative ATP-dependent zinc protease n=1 Tax=Endozoicomonas sp. SCSIO W0465 TaxID=2918516 RepID=UPI002075A9C6|nr:RimK/LysX family protein [Endozoicomonas sp. SCSIO W0465]USE37850.1 RimK/LysX family protein [Endozoicomonas sp. SCSIO W0465]